MILLNDKNFLDLEGLKEYHKKISAKIKDTTFSGDYNDLTNKPTILNAIVDEANETLKLI